MASVSCLAFPAFAASDSPAAGPEQSDDIVVTAQRREQKAQDVGIAISALGSAAIKNMNITDASDLTRAVPTLKMNSYSSSQVVFNIRGISQNDFGDQQEPPVAVYQDDSYGSSLNTSSFPTFDLQRVEVLRGPQGTLFGRNATGGAVQFISNKPKDQWGGYVSATTGSYGQIVTEGAITGPITDKLQFRLAGIRDRDHGYLQNILPGYANQGAANHWALRGMLAWQPSSDFNALLTLRYLRAPNERMAGIYTPASACPNAMNQGYFLGANETCSYWSGIGNPGPGTTATGYRNDKVMPQFGGSPWKTAAGDPGYVDRKLFSATLRLEGHLGIFDLVSITDFQHGSKYLTDDEDATPDQATTFSQGSSLYQGSEEVRVLAHFKRHELTVGAYGMIIEGRYYGSFGDPFYGYVPEANFTQKTQSFAFFAQDEWSLTDSVKLIGGLRYWHDHRIGAYNAYEPSTGVGIVFNQSQVGYSSFGTAQDATGLTVSPASATPSFSGVTARAEVEYKPSKDVMLYGSFNRGSKSGGFTFSLGTPFPGGEVSALNGTPYKPETLDAFEVGVKSTLTRGTTLNISAFYYNYQDYQAFAQYGSVQTVVNLHAHSKGIEAEFTTHPVRGLMLQLSSSLLNTKVFDVPLPDANATRVTHALPQAPGFSGSAVLRYEFPLLGGLGSFQADAQHSGGFCFTVLCAPVEQEAAYNIVNLRAGFTTGDGRIDFAAFVNNLNKEKYRIYAFDESLFGGNVAQAYGKPRTWGITATYHFGAQ
ncbi:TonB-dependent receptor [Novosphingobium nitrogenifigens DSM 19370]|uniref:TonB-dependent receptor n=2 Tax=Novosphingobium nitrogenifigens TaxID=378548 RepID=F1Z7D3_9SPHN|nr:TonB-dependent receptor [Novosphingobium nitrogenifigens]EGD59445.1 TonB-dependent receptor [Novosphingobium nitrogenifigens DSM 19370]